jgi:dTDP-4-dehydrorhamnose reductase
MLGHDIFNVLYESYEVVGKGRRQVDVTMVSDLSRTITSIKPDFVVNASGYTKVESAEDQPDEKIGPYAEEDEPSPLNVYGESKLEGEKEVVSSGCEYLIVRTQWLFGPHGKNFVFSIIDKLNRDGKASVVDDQYGCPTYTVDLALAVLKLMRLNQRGIFHFSGCGEVSWYGFACKIAEYSIPEEVNIIPLKSSDLRMKARRPRNSVLSKEKYSRVVGENPRLWEEMLRDFLRRSFEGGVAW